MDVTPTDATEAHALVYHLKVGVLCVALLACAFFAWFYWPH